MLTVQDTTSLNYSTHPATAEVQNRYSETTLVSVGHREADIYELFHLALREAIHMVASIGGFLGRKCDGEPGSQTLWPGLQRLDDITEMWKISMSVLAPRLFHPPPASSINVGKDKF